MFQEFFFISIEQKSWNIDVPGFHSMDIALKIA